jgi:hypothetical protein
MRGRIPAPKLSTVAIRGLAIKRQRCRFQTRHGTTLPKTGIDTPAHDMQQSLSLQTAI